MKPVAKLWQEMALPWIYHLLRVTKEFVVTVLFSLSPILISGLAVATFTNESFIGAVINNFNGGEVFLYTAAFLAPYIVNRLSEGVEGIFKELCFYLFWSVLLSGSYVFLVIRIESLITGSLKIQESTLGIVSYFVVVFTALIWYYSVWPNHYKPKGQAYQKNEEEMKDLDEKLDKKLGV
ncbi:hypothetical protein [Shewanella algae]|uniref:hypothetical protein n=1 Tax=Shewanella algae TaxID=38313 RepID=UPI0030074B3F